ncbi:MAG: aminopeptidase P family protein [Gammaproteobacteria bacterium]|nr:aminopeptidase P family protein [Gammaproteobacteria bacterium]MCP5198832.1 aminopeptidase P family protein [Gammaproteobacteria bacterium]
MDTLTPAPAASLSAFPPAEYAARRARARDAMRREGLDAILVSTPENIYYLTGLDHMGYFAYQMLVLALDGEPVLITRAMERVTIELQVPDLVHVGYSDGSHAAATGDPGEIEGDIGGNLFVEPLLDERSRPGVIDLDADFSPPVKVTCGAVADLGLAAGRLGLEMGGSFLSYRVANGIQRGLPQARWHDATGLVDQLRQVQSPAELAYTRRAAVISDAMLQAAIAAAGERIHHGEIMAAIYDAMFRRGGTYPGFVPLVRSSANLLEEHGTWGDISLAAGDLLFLEMSGCARRYHAPMGRVVHIGDVPASAGRALEVCAEAQTAAFDALRPGVLAGDVYAAWQGVLDGRGLASYRRHHCGYAVGIGYPPSWSGGGVPVGLRADSTMPIRAGMVFHLMSWLLRSEHGDSFLSDTVVVTADGAEMLTTTTRELLRRI